MEEEEIYTDTKGTIVAPPLTAFPALHSYKLHCQQDDLYNWVWSVSAAAGEAGAGGQQGRRWVLMRVQRAARRRCRLISH